MVDRSYQVKILNSCKLCQYSLGFRVAQPRAVDVVQQKVQRSFGGFWKAEQWAAQ